MKALIDEKGVEKFKTKDLYLNVLNTFDDYNLKQFAFEPLNYPDSLTVNSDVSDYIEKFKSKLNFVKSQFTDDEDIIYKLSIEERRQDKEIMIELCKSAHRYYEIKKSCYLKLALTLGLLKLK